MTGEIDRREIFGWVMYDWANSAYITTVVTVLIGPFLTALAQRDVGDNGVVLSVGPYVVTAKSLFPYCISLSVFLQVFILPVLGALADYTHLKKRLMAMFCYTGAVATCLLVFVTGRGYLAGGLLLVISNLCFGVTIVLYNAYLNDIAPDDQRDAVSSRGYALGYLGGGLLLAANLATILGAPALGISKDLAVRLSLLSAGLWWGGFSIVTFTRLKPRTGKKVRPASARPRPQSTEPLGLSRYMAYVTIGVSELIASFRELRVLPGTLRYLIAYMFFNDGIQTVISVASVFLAQELFVARGLETNESFLISLILMVQFVAFFGSLIFERIAALGGTKNAILLSLFVWSAIVIYAYGFLQTTTQAWVMGAVIALVLGGSQALSRSIFSQMIPAGREAAFFGVYEISERGTSWIGPLIFGAVVGSTGSYRQAILSLIALFVVGMVVLLLTDTSRAIRDAERVPPVHEATELS